MQSDGAVTTLDSFFREHFQEKQSIMIVSMDPPEPPPNEPPYTQQEIRQIMKNIYKGRIMFVQKRTIHFLRAKIDPRWYYIVVGTKV